MNRTKLLSLALALAAAGCSAGAGQAPAVSDPIPGGAALATVTIRATFPAGAVDPSLVSTATTSIVVSWQPENAISTAAGTRTLTPGTPSTTIRLPVGKYFFAAEARDAGNVVLETAGTAGKLIAGENALAILFMTGRWTFVDAGDSPVPVELVASTANGSAFLRLDAFDLTPRWFAPRPAAFDARIPMQYAEYDQTWITNDDTNPNKDGAQLHLSTQFGGGASNLTLLDGGDWNVTLGCGGSGGTCGNGPGGIGERSFRIAGDFGDSARFHFDPAEGLLPLTFTPDIRGYSTRMESGTRMKGYLFEWVVRSFGAPVVMENLSPVARAVPAPQTATARTAIPGMVVHEPQPIVLCRSGYNGNTVQSTGDWSFTQMCCDSGPCTPCGTCDVRDGGGNFLYATCGSLAPGGNPGTCNWGLVSQSPSGDGEWCDNWNWSFNRCDPGGNGIVEPNEFHDLNRDGVIDIGSYYFRHGLDQTATLDAWVTPFTAKGTQLGQSVGITIN